MEAAGEAAFYGPKIDVQMKNVNGKEDTAFTVQYDFVMPKRFDLKYINEKGEAEQPIVVAMTFVPAVATWPAGIVLTIVVPPSAKVFMSASKRLSLSHASKTTQPSP